jgi:pimeloyl-ACP methyl ester carboxylesterase
MYIQALPHGELAVIPHAGHFAFSEQPETFARVVSEFLGKLK